MSRKSSEKIFRSIINRLYDNSMGDQNYLPFSFIDAMSLQDKFEDFLVESVTQEAYDAGYEDGATACRTYSRRFTFNDKLHAIYLEGRAAGQRGD